MKYGCKYLLNEIVSLSKSYHEGIFGCKMLK